FLAYRFGVIADRTSAIARSSRLPLLLAPGGASPLESGFRREPSALRCAEADPAARNSELPDRAPRRPSVRGANMVPCESHVAGCDAGRRRSMRFLGGLAAAAAWPVAHSQAPVATGRRMIDVHHHIGPTFFRDAVKV